MCDIVVTKFTFAISSPDEFLSDSVIPNDCRLRVLLRWDESFGDGEGETRRAVAWVTASEARGLHFGLHSFHNGLPHGFVSRFERNGFISLFCAVRFQRVTYACR